MKGHTEVQIIKQGGQPMFAVIPYEQYLELTKTDGDEGIYFPNEVVGLQIEKGMSLIAAWRNYKGISQQQLADHLDISQPAVAQLEREGNKPHLSTLKKVAKAMGIVVEQLKD